MRRYRRDHRNPARLRYGWRLTQAGYIMVDPVARDCIYQILLMRRDGATLQKICDALVASRCPAPRSGRWYCATVRKVIE